MITDAQVRKLMSEKAKTGRTGIAALKAGMSRNTAAKYLKEGKLPSEMKGIRDWRTRPDPFQQHWAEIEVRLVGEPGLEARSIFEELQELHPGQYEPGQLRTLQRRIRQWRGLAGPDKEVFFPQAHLPGEALQPDFTWAHTLGVTIQGEPFPHLLCHPVLPYSNWEWVTVCHSESLAALKRGVQEALFRLGHAPKFHQTDNSTAATHDLTSGKRDFNAEYLDIMNHFGMIPRTIAVGEKEQNGDVEGMHRGLKRRLKQYLLLRGSNDFESAAVYENWLWRMMAVTDTLASQARWWFYIMMVEVIGDHGGQFEASGSRLLGGVNEDAISDGLFPGVAVDDVSKSFVSRHFQHHPDLREVIAQVFCGSSL